GGGGGGGGGRMGGGPIENGRVNGHPEMSNGSWRDESGTTADATIQAILSKVKAQGMAQEQRAKEQKTNTGAKGRGGGTGTRKKRKANEITKERSPKEEEEYLIGMDGMRGPPSMTTGQVVKARLSSNNQGGGGGLGGGIPSGGSAPYYHHQMSNPGVAMRPQPPPVQVTPS
ncbi:hypothetical protein PENTCL1PPCAC_22607, partial [Pristionchus entomophagus]